MEDLKLKHITGLIKLNGRVTIHEDDFGTSFCPTIASFNQYAEEYVTEMSTGNGGLEIHIQHEI